MKTTKRLTIEYVKDFLLSKNITLLEDVYINVSTPMLYKCNICDNEWKNRFNNIHHLNQGCPVCSRNRRTDESKLDLNFVNDALNKKNVELIGNYNGAKSKSNFKCKNCKYEWFGYYSNIIHRNKNNDNNGCPNCQKIKLSKRKILSQMDVKIFLESKNIILEDIYINSKTPILCKCKNCGHKWKSNLNYIKYYDSTCQNCNNQKFISEKICRYIFEKIFGFDFPKVRIKCKGINGGNLELDGYNDKLKIAFEHNGVQHYKPKIYGKELISSKEKFDVQIKNDKIKQKWCKDNGIQLIIIRELGKYTTEKNIKDVIKRQCNTLPKNFEEINFRLKDIKNKIIKQSCDGKEDKD